MRRQINMDELADFYRRIGAALWHVQHLENAMVQFLTMKEIHERRRAGKKVDDCPCLFSLREKAFFVLSPGILGCRR